MPIKWRSLAQTLNPQPLAFAVIKRVLDWIDRCDQASQRNLPAPPFRADDGGPIFPAEGSEDECWWLTDVKRTDDKKAEKGDEDGPPDSESDAQDGEDPKAADALTTDSDPDSPRSDRGEPLSQTVVLPVRFDSRPATPYNAWADSAGGKTVSRPSSSSCVQSLFPFCLRSVHRYHTLYPARSHHHARTNATLAWHHYVLCDLLSIFHTGSRPERAVAMIRVFEHQQLEALAERASAAAAEDVVTRFYCPVVGTLSCKYAGVQNPEDEIVKYDTKVVFKWELRGPRVKGSHLQVLEAHHAMRMLADYPVVPFPLKRPLVAAYLHKKIGSGRLLPAMKSPAYADLKLAVHAIAMSKPLAEPLRTTFVKPRHGCAREVPICARISETHSLASLPHGPDARGAAFSFGRDKFRRVADRLSTKKKVTKKAQQQPSLAVSAAADVVPLKLPDDLSAYDRRPWRCLRDVVAHAHFRAEQMRASAEGGFDLARALSAMETCPFRWDATEAFNDTTVFIVWTSGDKGSLEYHLHAANVATLCLKAGAKRGE